MVASRTVFHAVVKYYTLDVPVINRAFLNIPITPKNIEEERLGYVITGGRTLVSWTCYYLQLTLEQTVKSIQHFCSCISNYFRGKKKLPSRLFILYNPMTLLQHAEKSKA